MTFFSHPPQISNFPPIIPVHFLPCFAKIIIPPTLKNPPCFGKIQLLFTYFMCISSPPYFDHDVFMQHAMHVLDAPGFVPVFFLNYYYYYNSFIYRPFKIAYSEALPAQPRSNITVLRAERKEMERLNH